MSVSILIRVDSKMTKMVDFSLKWPEKVEFSISVIIENCAWGKSVKNFKYKIYLMKCIQKG